MRISVEEIVEIVAAKVIEELLKIGIEIEYNSENKITPNKVETSSIELDMSCYNTPLITENSLLFLEKNISEVVVPIGTVITPVAKEIIKKRELKITYKNKSN